MLCTQYIDTAVTVYTYKLFGQQKNSNGTRYIPSKLADEFLTLYRNCRYILTEAVFDEVYTALKERAKYNNTDDSSIEEGELVLEADEFDDLTRPVNVSNKYTSLAYNKDTTERQLKAKRYLEIAQQPYKEKCVKVQTDKLRHYSFNILSAGEGAYVGLKGQLTSARNDTLTLFLKIALYFDSQRDRYNYDLSIAQNTILNQFINKEFYYNINSIVATRGLKIIYSQKQKLDAELDVASDRDFVRSIYTSVFTQTIGIDCLYKLEGKAVLIVAEFDRFYYILGTTDALLSTRRLLELVVRLRKRTARLERLYIVGIGASSNVRDRISTKYDDPNLVGNEDNEATLARRNSELQRPIQQQANRYIVAPSGKVYYNCITSYVYSRYACLKSKSLYNARYKHKGYTYENKFGTILERLLTTALLARQAGRLLTSTPA